MTDPATSQPLVAAVVLNWNRRGLTDDCLQSLQRSSWPRTHLIVVDNASTDDSVAFLRQRHPHVELIVNRQNLGFAEGNNVGIRRAMEIGADHVLILNNDTIVGERAIEELVAEVARRPDVGAVSPLIYFADPPDLLWFAGAEFDPARGYPGRMLGYRERDGDAHAGVRETDRLTGAAMLVPRATVERTGMFDADLYFLYEDVDWSLRMRAAGMRLYVVPAAKVWHRVAATQGGEHSPLSIYYGMRNHLVVSRRHASLGRFASLRRTVVATAVNAARLRRADQRLKGTRALLAGLVDGMSARLGPWRASPS